MARNVEDRILKPDPKAKVLVWVGMGHIAKKPMEAGGKPVEFFALRLWKRTGIEPYCINQVSDSGDAATDRSVYRLLAKTGIHKIRRPAAFTRDEQRPSAPRGNDHPIYGLCQEVGLDAMVIHPPAPFERGAQRPQWLRNQNLQRTAVRLDTLLPAFDPAARYLVQAIPRDGGDDAAPDDQLIATPTGAGALYLTPGLKHTLRVWHSDSRGQDERVVLECEL